MKVNHKMSLLAVSLTATLLAGCNSDDNQTEVETIPEAYLTSSEVDFANCREIAGGITVAKSALTANIPSDVPVFSLTDMGFVFDGSDDLGMLIVRSLSCEAVQVTDSEGNQNLDENITIVQVGAPIDTSNLPATHFNYDGHNGADFNIYTLNYTTSSPAYFGALERAGFKNASLNTSITNQLVDLDQEQCSNAYLSVNVPDSGDYGLTISGEVVEATEQCHVGGVNFIGNWWSKQDAKVAVMSNLVNDQTYTETAGANVFVSSVAGSKLSEIMGSTMTRFTGFSGSGFLPSGGLGDVDMHIQALSDSGY
ncbi:hypothetical protein [Paraferrimonas sp. SM1919]|uniref:hypothetical protein n=1 Tax=Paraferrimonas sp. SM1919 TaxID=2662263 RepID=UPI0013D6A719|nr:hypothetical protein [Paraferrimonas sp. SM1919]